MTEYYVAIGPRREGMWKQPPAFGSDVDEVIEEACHVFELPVQALDRDNWEYVRYIGEHGAWRYKTNSVPYSESHEGKHYVYKVYDD